MTGDSFGTAPMFELAGGRPSGPGPMETSCLATLAALHAGDLLEARHQAQSALVLSLARAMDAIGSEGAGRRGTPLALLARELREALATLPEPPAGVDGAWTELEAALREAATRNTTGPVAPD